MKGKLTNELVKAFLLHNYKRLTKKSEKTNGKVNSIKCASSIHLLSLSKQKYEKSLTKNIFQKQTKILTNVNLTINWLNKRRNVVSRSGCFRLQLRGRRFWYFSALDWRIFVWVKFNLKFRVNLKKPEIVIGRSLCTSWIKFQRSWMKFCQEESEEYFHRLFFILK